jgi:hypothetical protein
MRRIERVAVVALVLGLALGIGAGAGAQSSTRFEQLRWTHPDPGAVRGYRVYYGTTSGDYLPPLDVGVPPTDGGGAFVYDLEVAALDAVYVSVTAYDAFDQESDASNERVLLPPAPPEPLGAPGQPIPILD